MDLKLLRYPDPLLAVPCEMVTEPIAGVILDEMFALCRKEKGYALAAPQVGISKTFFVMPPHENLSTFSGARVIINPRMENPRGEFRYQESCLSLPGVSASLVRPSTFTLAFQDQDFNSHRVFCHGLLGRVVQHECDHLLGKLFIERLDSYVKMKLAPKLEVLRRKSER